MLTEVPQRPQVTNEPVYSNVSGTIAMAKLGGQPHSATSQWFINLGNNAASLDVHNENGGYTVFGEVTAELAVVNEIAAVPTYNGVSGFNDFPLQNYTAPDALVNANYVIVTRITVTDPTVDSAAGLNPTPTTAGNGGRGDGGGGGGGGGGGSFGWLALTGLLAVGRRRYRISKTA